PVPRLVGMEWPGCHSMIAGVALRAADTAGRASVGYAVVGVDERVRLVTIEVDGGGLGGRVEAFVRPLPVEQPSMDDVAARVSRGQFRAQRVLGLVGPSAHGVLTATCFGARGG